MMVISGEALDVANTQLKQAEEMLARAYAIISRTEPVRKAKTARLKEMTAESIQIHLSGAKKRTALEEIKSALEKMTAFNREELKPQTLLKVEEERNNVSALETKIKSYERQS